MALSLISAREIGCCARGMMAGTLIVLSPFDQKQKIGQITISWWFIYWHV
jgi:hypothetical protein